MPRNGSGVYSVPNTFTPNTIISSSAVNANFSDAGQALTDSLARDGQGGMTGQIKAVDGTVGAPGISFVSDLDTGLRRRGPNSFGWVTGGVDAGYVDATQKLFWLGDVDFAAAVNLQNNLTVGGTLGVTGNATFAPTSIVEQQSTSHTVLPRGTTAQRPAPTAGFFRYNNDIGNIEVGNGADFITPLTTQPITGYTGLVVQNNAGVPNTRVDIAATSMILNNASNTSVRVNGVSLTADILTGGANGLDTGGVAPSAWYSVWVIYNPSTVTVASLLSLSATSPTLPGGFTFRARVGWMRTNGSSQFLRVMQKGNRAQYIVSAAVTTVLPTIIGGVQALWTAAPVAAVVPTTADQIAVVLHINGSGSADFATNNLYSGAGSATNPSLMSVNAGALNQSMSGMFLLESANVYFSSSAANGLLQCLGWKDNI